MDTLIAAILSLLTLPCGQHVAHARRYDGGAHAYAAMLAEHTAQAAQTYEVDPLLLVALADSESGLDGTRVGELGEVGLLQFMPRGAPGRAYRLARGSQAERDGLALLLGAEALRHGLRACGSEARAVGWFKSGRCVAGPKARWVLALRDRMMGGGV